MNTNDITYFGETNYRNERKRFGIKRADRRRHMYIIGKTGTGKTTLLDNMTVQDIQRGNGVAVIDPHGEYAERMLSFVPKERINDVVYFNPADLEHPLGFNMLEKPVTEMRHFVASGLMGVFKKLWPDVWSARMEYFLSNSILAHLELNDATLIGVNRIFGDRDYRKSIVSQIQDPIVKGFWENEFAKLPEQFMREAVAAIQNKVGQFISNPLIRNIIGQPGTSFSLRDIMDKKKILIANLSKGRIGEENSKLLGAMLVTRIYLTAMSRVDVSEDEREDFYVYVDEFQNFATESFASILSEARKYHLNLTMAHQYMEQLIDDKTKSAMLRGAVIGNVGTMISFRIGAEDAEVLEKEFAPEFTIEDFVNLGFAQIYLKLMIDGVASRPFSATTLAPIPLPHENYTQDIIQTSRNAYGRSSTDIEHMITSWSRTVPLGFSVPPAATIEVTTGTPRVASQGLPPRMNESPPPRQAGRLERREESAPRAAEPKPKKANQKMYPAVCAVCGKDIEVPFQPDNRRPVYCTDHLSQIQRGLPRQAEGNQQGSSQGPKDAPREKREAHPFNSEPVQRAPNEPAISLNQLRPRDENSPRPRENRREDRRDQNQRRQEPPQKKLIDLGELRKVLQETMPAANPGSKPLNELPKKELPQKLLHREGNGGVILPGKSVKF